jgi:hypothetical protein
MKAVFIAYNRGISEEVSEALESLQIRGFTHWNNVQGQGSIEGEPHMGTHIWSGLNSVILNFFFVN